MSDTQADLLFGNIRKTVDFEPGTKVSGFLSFALGQVPPGILAVAVNDALVGMQSMLPDSPRISVEAVIPGHPAYPRLYQQTAMFMFLCAAKAHNPAQAWKTSHSIGDGLYIQAIAKVPDTSEISRIEKIMRELALSRAGIRVRNLAWAEAREVLGNAGCDGVAELLKFSNSPEIPVATFADFASLALHPLPETFEAIRIFELLPYDEGVLLRVPRSFDFAASGTGQSARVSNSTAASAKSTVARQDATDSSAVTGSVFDKTDIAHGSSAEVPAATRVPALPPFQDIPLLGRIYREHQAWNRILGIEYVGDLNVLTHEKNVKEYIWVAEALQAEKIVKLAGEIARRPETRVVLIAGPSSSGKTTFTKKLGIQLQAVGLMPKAISLDDFFVPRELTPRDEDGKFDFENIDALDRGLLSECIGGLLAGKKIHLPKYNFVLGDRVFSDEAASLAPNEILVLEGIHGLNPQLLPDVDAARCFRIYISALTQINLDAHHRISTTDNRLIRRMVRDYRYRGYSASRTLEMWPSVRRGEDKNIFPFQSFADGEFNSALGYELGVLKPLAEALLRGVPPYSPGYSDAQRLLEILSHFLTIAREFVPDMSILREFIGGSAFKY